MISSKHLKTVSDLHEAPVISIKFCGDLSYTQKRISAVSSDLEGIVYLTYFSEGMLNYQVVKQCFMKRRVGPTFSIAPFLMNSSQVRDYVEDNEAPAPVAPYQ